MPVESQGNAGIKHHFDSLGQIWPKRRDHHTRLRGREQHYIHHMSINITEDLLEAFLNTTSQEWSAFKDHVSSFAEAVCSLSFLFSSPHLL